MAQTSVPPVNAKRRRRIERELRAFYAMQSHMNTRDFVLSLLAIPFLALLCFLVGAKLHLLFGHLWVSILAATACGGAIWLIGRRWFALAGLIVIALLMILFEDIPDVWSGGEQQKPDPPAPRRRWRRPVPITSISSAGRAISPKRCNGPAFKLTYSPDAMRLRLCGTLTGSLASPR